VRPKPHQNSGHRASRIELLPVLRQRPCLHLHLRLSFHLLLTYKALGGVAAAKGLRLHLYKTVRRRNREVRPEWGRGGEEGGRLRELTKDFDIRLGVTCAKTSTKNISTANRQMKNECVTTPARLDSWVSH